MGFADRVERQIRNNTATGKYYRKKSYDAEIARYKKIYNDRLRDAPPFVSVYGVKIQGKDIPSADISTVKAQVTGHIGRLEAKSSALESEISNEKREKTKFDRIKEQNGIPIWQTQSSANTSQVSSSSPTYEIGRVKYNLPVVRSALFAKTAFRDWDERVYIKNTPARVSDAKALWTKGINSKGMIQTWKTPQGEVATQGSTDSGVRNRYGFQFHYNPSSISMSYGIQGNVDFSMYASGAPATIPFGASLGGAGTISFSLLLNRVADMNFFRDVAVAYNGTQLQLRDGVNLSEEYGGAYSPAEAKRIYNEGTMYDVRALIRAINGGLESRTQFRGTSVDLGFLIGRPVEIHLGKDLRYLGIIQNLSVDHRIFDYRMVPTMSNVNVTVVRIPDFLGTNFDSFVDTATESSSGVSTNSIAGDNSLNPEAMGTR